MDPKTLWRGQRDTRRTIWARWLVISLLVHAPITPLAGLIGLVALLVPDSTEDTEPPPALTEIPIDLLNEEPGAGAESAPPPAPPAAESGPSEPVEVPKKRPPRPIIADGGAARDAGVADAGAPDAGPSDAGLRDAGPADAGTGQRVALDAGPPDAGPAGLPDAGDAGAGVADPFAIAGGARSVVDSNANVSVNVSTEKLRSHKLGARVGALLASVHQWRDFFGPTGIDPVRDTDAIWIWGPQFRRTADVAAIVQHRLGAQRMRQALDRLVMSDPEGSWAEHPVPVATAHADGAPRRFVMPSQSIVVLSTEGLLPSALRFKPRRLPAIPGAAVALVRVKTPWRAFKGINFRVPQSIAWARASVEPTADGGALINIEAEDESVEAARSNADEIGRAIVAVTQLDLGFIGEVLGQRVKRFVQDVHFESQGTHIHGQISLTEAQVVDILSFARERLAPPPPRPVPSPSTPSRSPSSASPAPSAGVLAPSP